MGMKQLQPNPEILIIDFLHTFFDDVSTLDTDQTLQAHFIDCHMLITAAAHNVADMLSKEICNKFISIICLDPECHSIYRRFVNTYVDLHYYQNDCILSMSDLLSHFS